MMDDIDRSFTWWQNALKGERGPIDADNPRSGFYRSKAKDKSLHAVAIWYDSNTNELRYQQDGRDVDDLRARERWPHDSKRPISEETFWAFRDTGVWPDVAEMVPAANREVSASDNAEPDDTPLDQQHATLIDNAIAAALTKVTTESEAAQALGSKNRIAELRLAADKAGKAEYQPPYQEYQRLYGVWTPPIKRAEAKEKELNTIVLKFRETERVQVAKEQADADERQRVLDEANARTADRAIAAGEPEPPPVVEEVPLPASPSPLVATYGTRKLKEELHTILESITDYDAVYAFLKAEPKVRALLLELATAKVKAGFTVPGTTTRQGLI